MKEFEWCLDVGLAYLSLPMFNLWRDNLLQMADASHYIISCFMGKGLWSGIGSVPFILISNPADNLLQISYLWLSAWLCYLTVHGGGRKTIDTVQQERMWCHVESTVSYPLNIFHEIWIAFGTELNNWIRTNYFAFAWWPSWKWLEWFDKT